MQLHCSIFLLRNLVENNLQGQYFQNYACLTLC